LLPHSPCGGDAHFVCVAGPQDFGEPVGVEVVQVKVHESDGQQCVTDSYRQVDSLIRFSAVVRSVTRALMCLPFRTARIAVIFSSPPATPTDSLHRFNWWSSTATMRS